MEISQLIVDGQHLDAVDLLNDRPYEYSTSRKLAGIGGIDEHGRTFTEVAIEEATHRLLYEMYLLPELISKMYAEGAIPSLKRLPFWDVPMLQTPIFNLILFSPYTVLLKLEDIDILLLSGYIPTGQDLERYALIIGRDNFYLKMLEKSPAVNIPLYSIFMGTRYERYRLLFSTNNKTDISSWRNTLLQKGIYDYGYSINTEDLLGDPISLIPPTHLMEIYDSPIPEAPRYLVYIRDIIDTWKNPYTNLRLSNDIINMAKLKREFLWMSGFPIIIPDRLEVIDISAKSEISILASRINMSLDILLRDIWNLRRYIEMNHSSRYLYSHESLCMYCNYILDSEQDLPSTLSIATTFGY